MSRVFFVRDGKVVIYLPFTIPETMRSTDCLDRDVIPDGSQETSWALGTLLGGSDRYDNTTGQTNPKSFRTKDLVSTCS